MGNYGVASVEKMRQVREAVDPKGIFTSLVAACTESRQSSNMCADLLLRTIQGTVSILNCVGKILQI